jgi:RNA polymerase sigma factor (sigma-70 family)
MTEPSRPSDGELLAEFLTGKGQTAFAELVNRHGKMVHGVALRVLADHHEAQDVAQAAFLILTRKASGLCKAESVGGWLHKVAWRVALDVQRSRRSRQQREEVAMHEQPAAVAANPDTGLFRAELDAALNQLPERYRQPLVLFHLEGGSLDEVGRMLGLNPNTLRTRLARARELLRKKLVRRGVTVGSVGALTTLLSAEAGAAVLPATFISATVQAASLAATGKLASGVGTGAVSANVAALTKGAIQMMFIAQLKTAALVTAACVVVAGGGVIVAKEMLTPPATPVSAQAEPKGLPPPTPATEDSGRNAPAAGAAGKIEPHKPHKYVSGKWEYDYGELKIWSGGGRNPSCWGGQLTYDGSKPTLPPFPKSLDYSVRTPWGWLVYRHCGGKSGHAPTWEVLDGEPAADRVLPDPAAVTAAPEGVVSFTLAADKTVFVAKDPLEFKVTVKNVSRQAYTFTTGCAHYYWKYHIKAADRDTEYEGYCAAKFEAVPAPFSARLAPGETAVQPIELGRPFRFRLLKGEPSDTGKRIEWHESAGLPAGRYAMTVEFDYRLVSEESVAGKATLGPVAFTLAGELETEAQRQARQAAEAMAQIERKPQIDRERELKERAIRERGP